MRKFLPLALAAPVALLGGLVGYAALAARRAEKRVPRDGELIDVDGARIHVVDRGEGPAIVMVHGLAAQLRNFSYALADRLAADHRVILIDRPGSGYSTAAPGSHPGLDGQAAIVAGVIEALGLEEPLLVGHSLGGAIALAVALARPGLLRGLALVAPLTQPIEGSVPAAFRALMLPSPAIRRAIAWTIAMPLGRLRRDAGLALVFGPEPVPDDYDVAGGGALVLRPGNFVAAASEVSGGTDALAAMARHYAELTVPTAILFGRGDRILDPALHGGTLSETAPDATLDLIEGGHMIPLTRPAETEAWLRRFEARIARAAR